MTDLVASARSFFQPGKGILAADESVATATKRLGAYGVPASEEMRRQYRDLFLGTPGVEEHLSGVIFFSETLTQKGNDRVAFPVSLAARGIMPGIKVDEGTEPFGEKGREFITNGLIGLPDRLKTFRSQGAAFTKWRAVFKIEGDALPSSQSLHENAKRLASYAKDVQSAGMIPILEPEVLCDGTHGRARTAAVLGEVLSTLFTVIDEMSVDRASLVLKTAMAISGKDSGRADTPEEVAEDTVRVLMDHVPRQIAGIVFLSGGQTPDQATDNLSAIVAKARQEDAPWPLTFSYARALQEEALAIWRGKEENVQKAREAFLMRLEKVSAAVR